MLITVIYKNSHFNNFVIGELSEKDKESLKELNNNTFNNDVYHHSTKYTDKSMYEIAEFLGIESTEHTY